MTLLFFALAPLLYVLARSKVGCFCIFVLLFFPSLGPLDETCLNCSPKDYYSN
jgi:hypothetical protein